MPMCDSGVPDRHTTAVSSSKIGARNVAPASATHATTPSAVVSISASTSSGDERRRHEPRTGAASNTRVPVPISVTAMECSRIAAVTISARARARRRRPTPGSFRLLHEVRLRGVVELDDDRDRAPCSIDEGFVVHERARRAHHDRGPRHAHGVGPPRAGRATTSTVARRAYERFLPLNRELIRICNDWQVRPGGVPNDHRDAQLRLVGHRPAARRSTTGSRRSSSRLGRVARALRALPARACAPHSRASTTASTSGSRRRASTRTTRSGCSCTRTCCSRSAAIARTNATRRAVTRRRVRSIVARRRRARSRACSHDTSRQRRRAPRRSRAAALRSTSRPRPRSRRSLERSPHALQRIARPRDCATARARSCACTTVESRRSRCASSSTAGPTPTELGPAPGAVGARRRAMWGALAERAAARPAPPADGAERRPRSPARRSSSRCPRRWRDALGWPGPADRLARPRASSPRTRAAGRAYGHPEWGAFRLGKAQPRRGRRPASSRRSRSTRLGDARRRRARSSSRSSTTATRPWPYFDNWHRLDKAAPVARVPVGRRSPTSASVVAYNPGSANDVVRRPAATDASRTCRSSRSTRRTRAIESDNPIIVLDAPWSSPDARAGAAAFVAFTRDAGQVAGRRSPAAGPRRPRRADGVDLAAARVARSRRARRSTDWATIRKRARACSCCSTSPTRWATRSDPQDPTSPTKIDAGQARRCSRRARPARARRRGRAAHLHDRAAQPGQPELGRRRADRPLDRATRRAARARSTR